jgi:cysteinyl-tRNA synthetase
MSTVELLLVIGLIGLGLLAGFLLGRRSRQPDAADGRVPTPAAATSSEAEARTARSSKSAEGEVVERRNQRPAGGASGTSEQPAADLLAQARSWGYQLQDLDIARAARSAFDVLVIDYAKDGTDDTALKPAEVQRLKTKPDGSRRLVLAYLSIGEAESYRGYWRREWERTKPGWLLGENPDWEENYAVCFWDPGWQALLCGRPDAYLDRILAQGFDGIYLDKCDVTEDLKRHERKAAASRPDLDGDMVRLVESLAAYARKARPGFLVVMQNAEPLLKRPELRRTIDAVAKEELLYGLDAAEKANPREEIDWSRERLDLMRRDGKAVFAVEYLDDSAKIAKAAERMRELGYVLYVSAKDRELDRLREAQPEA